MKILWALPLAICLMIMAVIWLAVNFNAWPVSKSKVERLKPGMTKAEIVKAIGTPSSRTENDKEWAYGKWYCWPIIRLTFDDRGHFEDYELDY